MIERTFSEFCLERYVLGELPPEEAREVERAAASDPRLRSAIDDISSSNRTILARYPAASFKAGLQACWNDEAEEDGPYGVGRRLFQGRGVHSRKAFALASVLTIIVLAAVLTIPRVRGLLDKAGSPGSGERTVVKGDSAIDLTKTRILVYRKQGDAAEIVNEGNEAGPGTLLQLGYVAAGEPYGIILSIDGRGSVSRHFPSEEGGSTLLVLNKKSLLPNAIELDDAPGFERFFLITSASPIDVADILARAAALGRDPARARRSDLDLPTGLKQRSVLILKREEAPR